MCPGGIIENPNNLFSRPAPQKPNVKGLGFDRSKVDDKPGNYIEHNVNGKMFYQVIGEDHWWDSPQKLVKIHPLTLKPLQDIPEPEKEPKPEIIAEPPLQRKDLEAMPYPDLIKKYKHLVPGNLLKKKDFIIGILALSQPV